MPSNQRRLKQTYNLAHELPPSLNYRGQPEYLSTHLTLTGAFRELKRYTNWATHGMRYQKAIVAAYITTEKHSEIIARDIWDLSRRVPHTQLHRIIVYQGAKLAPHVPKGQQLPQDRSATDRKHHREAQKQVKAKQQSQSELATLEAKAFPDPIEPPHEPREPHLERPLPRRPLDAKRPPRKRLAFTILPHNHPSEQPNDTAGTRVSTHTTLLAAYEALIRYRRAHRTDNPPVETCLVTERNHPWVQEQINALALTTKQARQHKTPIKVYHQTPPEFHGDQPTYQLATK